MVIAMMAILTGFIVPKINFGGEKKQIKTEALRLAELMQRASEESIFKTRELGIKFTDGDYQFLILDGDGRKGKWVPYESQMFRKREWPDEFNIGVEISGVVIELEDGENFKIDEKTRPHVMFLSNGEILPDFRILVDKGLSDSSYQIASGVEELVTVGLAEEL